MDGDETNTPKRTTKLDPIERADRQRGYVPPGQQVEVKIEPTVIEKEKLERKRAKKE